MNTDFADQKNPGRDNVGMEVLLICGDGELEEAAERHEIARVKSALIRVIRGRKFYPPTASISRSGKRSVVFFFPPKSFFRPGPSLSR
jgi:hypothetical protein